MNYYNAGYYKAIFDVYNLINMNFIEEKRVRDIKTKKQLLTFIKSFLKLLLTDCRCMNIFKTAYGKLKVIYDKKAKKS